MRRVRLILGLAVAVCAFSVLAAPAFAAEPVIFGKFIASITGKTVSEAEPGIVKGHGEVSELKLGPYKFTCEKELKSKGKITSESSDTFFQEVRFTKCTSSRKLEEGLGEEVHASFTLGLEFHSNGSAELGEGESEVKILANSPVAVKASKSSCVVWIPAQTIPIQAEKKPEKEYEAAGYFTEVEKVEGKGLLKKFPDGVREKLDISMEFKKIETLEKPPPVGGCTYSKVEEPEGSQGKYNPAREFNNEKGWIESKGGRLEAELEEIELKNGDLGFEPKV